MMDLDNTPPKINGSKNTVSKLMDLDDTPSKVNGPTVHLTRNKTLKMVGRGVQLEHLVRREKHSNGNMARLVAHTSYISVT